MPKLIKHINQLQISASLTNLLVVLQVDQALIKIFELSLEKIQQRARLVKQLLQISLPKLHQEEEGKEISRTYKISL